MSKDTKIPQTLEELEAFVNLQKEEAFKKGVEKGTTDSQDTISKLESKVALVENNPLSYPRFIGPNGEVYELPVTHPIILKMGTAHVQYEHEDFMSDKTAKAKFDMTVTELLESIFKVHKHIFIKK